MYILNARMYDVLYTIDECFNECFCICIHWCFSAYFIDPKMTDHVQIVVFFNLGFCTTHWFADMETGQEFKLLARLNPVIFSRNLRNLPIKILHESYPRHLVTICPSSRNWFKGKAYRRTCRLCRVKHCLPGDVRDVSHLWNESIHSIHFYKFSFFPWIYIYSMYIIVYIDILYIYTTNTL